MSAGKNKRLRQQTFVFLKSLTKVPPASAGSGARQHGNLSIRAQLKNDLCYRKGEIILRKYHLYAAVLCSAAVLGLGGCSNKVDAATTLPLVNESRPVVVESEEPTSSAEETTVVETVSGTIESAEEQPEQAEDSVCLFGPATQMEDGRLSIDSQADQGYQGEVILNVSQESTYVLDAVSGLPIELSDIKDGDTIYAYIGPAMTMSLPPMTNANDDLCQCSGRF